MSSTESSSNLELLDQDIPKPDLKSGTCQSTANDLEDLPCEGLLSDEEKGRPSDEAQADKTVKTADEAQPGPVDEGFSWVILAASVFVISAFPVNNMSYGVFLAELIDHYQRPQAVFGLMGAVRVFIIFMIGRPVFSSFCCLFTCISFGFLSPLLDPLLLLAFTLLYKSSRLIMLTQTISLVSLCSPLYINKNVML